MAVKITVHINYSEDFKRLLQIVESAHELRELVPEWSSMEADALYDKILEIAKDSTTTKRE